MKGLAFSIFLFICCHSAMAHGGHMAGFKYEIKPGSIVLEFQIENSVLQHFDLESKCESYETATAWCLYQYITANTSLKINDDAVTFELENSNQNEDFLIVTMSAKGDFSNTKNISLSNKCFLEFDRRFENRVTIQRRNGVKSYLLNRQNAEIFVTKF